jgi:hypothetical protein
VKRFRERSKTVSGNVSETPPDNREQITERKKDYAFEFGVIRLLEKDLGAWKKSFSYLDVPAELTGMAQWAGEQGDWYHACSGLLARRNREAKTKADAQRRVGEPKFQYGVRGAI